MNHISHTNVLHVPWNKGNPWGKINFQAATNLGNPHSIGIGGSQKILGLVGLVTV